MKKNIIIYLTFLSLIVFYNQHAYAQSLTPNEQNQVKDKINSLVSDFVKYGTLTENSTSVSDDYYQKLLAVFTSQNARIYNILPIPKEVEKYTLSQFYEVVKVQYSSGLSIEADLSQIQFSEFVYRSSFSGSYYQIHATLNVKIVTKFEETLTLRKESKLNFLFKVPKNLDKLDELTIEGIYNDEQLAIESAPWRMLGFQLGLVYSPKAYTNWKSTEVGTEYTGADYSHGYGLDLRYTFKKKWAIKTGFMYYTGAVNMHSKNKGLYEKAMRIDEDGDNFFMGCDFEIDEKIKYQHSDIPLLFIFNPGNKNKINFYVGLGVIYSKVNFTQTVVTGTVTRRGKYPDYNIIFEDEPLLGFTTENNFTKTYDWQVSITRKPLVFELGTSIPLSTYFSVNAGLYAKYSLSEFMSNTSRNEFDLQNYDIKNNTVYTFNDFGANIGIYFKF